MPPTLIRSGAASVSQERSSVRHSLTALGGGKAAKHISQTPTQKRGQPERSFLTPNSTPEPHRGPFNLAWRPDMQINFALSLLFMLLSAAAYSSVAVSRL